MPGSRRFAVLELATAAGVSVGILAAEHVPFGGVRRSSLGREGSHHGMDDHVEIKYVYLGGIPRRD